MAGSVIRGDDLIALVACCAAFCACGLTLQLVHFIQHRKRPSPSHREEQGEANSVTSTDSQLSQHDAAA